MNKQRIVILGSKSFIAQELITRLKDLNFQVVEISRAKINFEDLKSVSKLKKIYKKNDKIVFVAAKAPVKNYTMLTSNLKICENIINSLTNINFKQFLYISSDAVYSDSFKKIVEKSLTVPDSYHGFMHLIRERMLANFTKKLTIVRPTLVFGNNDPHNGYGPNMFIRSAQKKINIKLFGKGEEKRDHVYVGDVANIASICLKKNKLGIFNAVSGNLYSFNQISKLVKKKYSIKVSFTKRKGPMPHNGYRAFNNKKVKSVLGYKKFMSVENYINLGYRYK